LAPARARRGQTLSKSQAANQLEPFSQESAQLMGNPTACIRTPDQLL
jgi:hypothetical protein